MDPVKQIKRDVYTPDWANPEPNFYAWKRAASKVIPIRENLGEGSFKRLFHIAGKDEVLAAFKPDKFTPEETEKAVLGFLKAIMALCSRLTDGQISFLRSRACLPTAVYCVPSNGRCGLILQRIPRNFDDNSTYICSHPRLFEERTNVPFKNYLHIALQTAFFFALYHQHDFVYGDISYNNIRIDPVTGSIYVIDVDGVCDYSKCTVNHVKTVHSPDFAAPETLLHGAMGVNTEAFTLAIFLYCILMHRHPFLPGRPMPDGILAEETEKYFLGTNPIYVDHPSNDDNRQLPYLCATYNIEGDGHQYPWVNPKVTPARLILGEPLARLFERTFVDCIFIGQRSTAGEFAQECLRTLNMIVPCENIFCRQAWVMPSYTHTEDEKCPICGRRLVRYARLCVYRYADKIGKYVFDFKDGLSIYDFRSLYEINFRSWDDIFTSGCETGERLGAFQEDMDSPNHFFFVSESSKKVVAGRIDKNGIVEPATCRECTNGRRTDVLDGGTVLFQPDNRDVVLLFLPEGAPPVSEICLPLSIIGLKHREFGKDCCVSPVSQKWRDWVDVWHNQTDGDIHSRGVPLEKCLNEVEMILSEVKAEERNPIRTSSGYDCSRIVDCCNKLEVLSELIQNDVENFASILLGALQKQFKQDVESLIGTHIGTLQNQFKQVAESSACAKEAMIKAIDCIVQRKKSDDSLARTP